MNRSILTMTVEVRSPIPGLMTLADPMEVAANMLDDDVVLLSAEWVD